MAHKDYETGECVEVTECRACGSREGYEVLDLSYHPVADTFLAKEQLSEPEVYYPLRTQACPRCGLMQTRFVVSPYIRYQKNPYCYQSSSSLTAVRHFSELAERASSFLSLKRSELVVDIGSNDGTLLKAFRSLGHDIMGIDPSSNICQKANAAGVETVNDFLTLDSAGEVVKRKGKAAVVTATNVFNHTSDIRGFVGAVDVLLRDKGTLVIEVPYLLDLIEQLAYDTIYHEHVSFFSVKSLDLFFNSIGYQVFHAERSPYIGGSIRIFAGRRQEHRPDGSVAELISLERERKLSERRTFEDFARRVYAAREELVWLLYSLKREGKRIVAIGAPTKGNTLLNFCKLGTSVLDFASDRIPEKLGRYMPGSHIPIVDDETVARTQPDYGLLLSWNLADEIIKKLSESLKFSGKFIIPIPMPRIIAPQVRG